MRPVGSCAGCSWSHARAEYAYLSGLGARFKEPVDAGPVTVAVLDDTCGNLIQLATEPR
jgi:hypothetical protein